MNLLVSAGIGKIYYVKASMEIQAFKGKKWGKLCKS